MSRCKCQLPSNVDIRPDGIHGLDACIYRPVEIHKNVTVTVSQCQTCGGVDISWRKQDDTESVILGYFIDAEEDKL